LVTDPSGKMPTFMVRIDPDTHGPTIYMPAIVVKAYMCHDYPERYAYVKWRPIKSWRDFVYTGCKISPDLADFPSINAVYIDDTEYGESLFTALHDWIRDERMQMLERDLRTVETQYRDAIVPETDQHSRGTADA
jgi:hypothetical protein